MNLTSEERVIQAKIKELSALVEQREQLQVRISKIEKAIRAFIELLEDERDQVIYTAQLATANRPLGLTDHVKRELQTAERLTPTAMRDRLAESGFPLSGYSNSLAVIYTTLTRMVDQGLARKTEDGEFEWVAPLTAGQKIVKAHYRKTFGQRIAEGDKK
jgi:hypothetical protein